MSKYLKALKYSGAMSLDGRIVCMDGAQQRIERNVSNIFIAIEQESAENIDGQHAQPTFRFDVHDRQHRLVKNSISNIF